MERAAVAFLLICLGIEPTNFIQNSKGATLLTAYGNRGIRLAFAGPVKEKREWPLDY